MRWIVLLAGVALFPALTGCCNGWCGSGCSGFPGSYNTAPPTATYGPTYTSPPATTQPVYPGPAATLQPPPGTTTAPPPLQ